MSLQEICDVLLVDLKERDLDLAIRLQILPLRETVIDVVKHSLNYALISALNHHVSGDLRDAGPVVDSSDWVSTSNGKSVWTFFALGHTLAADLSQSGRRGDAEALCWRSELLLLS